MSSSAALCQQTGFWGGPPLPCVLHVLQAARGLFRKDAIHPLDAQHVSLGRMDAAGALADAGALAALALPHDSWARAGMGARAAGGPWECGGAELRGCRRNMALQRWV